MPFVSEAQRRKFGEMLRDGKIDQKTYDKMAQGTPAKLPDRLTPEKER